MRHLYSWSEEQGRVRLALLLVLLWFSCVLVFYGADHTVLGLNPYLASESVETFLDEFRLIGPNVPFLALLLVLAIWLLAFRLRRAKQLLILLSALLALLVPFVLLGAFSTILLGQIIY